MKRSVVFSRVSAILLSLTMMLTCFGAAPAFAAAPSNDGYITNGDFETGTTTGWSVKSPAKVVAGGREGSGYAFRLEGIQWNSAQQYVAVEPHTDYRLTGWVKRVSGTGAHYLYAKGPNDQSLESLNGSKQWFNQTSEEWVKHVYEFNSGNYSNVRIYMTIEDAGSVFLYDDISLEKLGTVSFDGYISNGDFESGVTSNWTVNGDSAIVSGGYNNSGYALRVNGAAGAVIKQNIKVEGLTDYRLTLHVRRVSGKGAHRVSVKNGDAEVETINGTSGRFSYTARQWKEHVYEFNSGKGTLLTVCFTIEDANNSFIYDDITIEKIEKPDYSAVLKGDVTLDGALDETDLSLLESALAGEAELEGAAAYAADLNYDGALNAADAALLRKLLDNASAATLLYPANGETVANASWQVAEMLVNYTPGKTDDYSGVGSRVDQYARDPVELRWGFTGEADAYTVLLADNAELTGAKSYSVAVPALSIQNLLVDKDYFWAVEVGGQRSEVGFFHTEDTIRTLWIEGVSNTRDIGGWKTADGTQRVRYGIAYRGAKFDDATADGKAAILDLGIKTDVDLRGNHEGVNAPLESIGVRWFLAGNNGCAMYNGTDVSSIEKIGSAYVNGTIAAVRAYADPANYPAYFHCSYGRDRTGTLGLMLLGVLGVPRNDILKDYELTFLSEWGGSGITATGHTTLLRRTMDWLQTNYAPGGTLQEAVEAYLLAAGLSAGDIASIRANMLEPVPAESGVELVSAPDKTAYVEGEALDLTGGRISVNYDNGESRLLNLTADMVGGFDPAVTGTQIVTVTYGGFTASFEVEVSEKQMTEIRITSLPDKLEYGAGEELDLTGIEITAYYNNGESEILASDAYEVSGYEATEGEHVVTVSVGDFSDTFTVTVVKRYKLGDPDNDGEITVADALAALRVAAKLAEPTDQLLATCDIDGDGEITVADALAILRVAAKLAVPFDER